MIEAIFLVQCRKCNKAQHVRIFVIFAAIFNLYTRALSCQSRNTSPLPCYGNVNNCLSSCCYVIKTTLDEVYKHHWRYFSLGKTQKEVDPGKKNAMATSMATNIVADGFTSKSRLKNAKVGRKIQYILKRKHRSCCNLITYCLASNTNFILRFSCHVFRLKTHQNAEHLKKDQQLKQAFESFTREAIFPLL